MADGQDWRWVFWILTIFAAFCFFVILFFVPETYAPALLMAKAKKMRKETGDDRWYAPRKSTALASTMHRFFKIDLSPLSAISSPLFGKSCAWS